MSARLVRTLAALALSLPSLAAGPAGAAANRHTDPPGAPALSPIAEQAFIHESLPYNVVGPATSLEYPELNNHPPARLVVTARKATIPNLPAWAARPDPLPDAQGVSYDNAAQRWAIYNEDTRPVVGDLDWSVYLPAEDAPQLLQTAYLTNTAGSRTFIDAARFNGRPDAILFAQHVNNPPGHASNVLSATVGVQYRNGHWYLVNLDGALLPKGAAFNVYYTSPGANAVSASASSTNATPGGLPGGVYTYPIGLSYNAGLSLTQIVTHGGPTFPLGLGYNVVAPDVAVSFVTTATAPLSDHFFIDHPLTNGRPQALLFVSARDNGTLNEKNGGVFYDAQAGQWAIFNEDQSSMAKDVAYNVFVGPTKTYLAVVSR